MVHRSSLSALLCVLALASIAVAQAPSDKTSQRARSKPKTTNSEEADAVAAQREVLAISLLQTLAEDARSFREPRLRARVQARVADAFWLTDAEKAKSLFRRAWEAAEIEDTENAKREAEDLNRQRQSGPVVIRSRRPDLRAEVLRLAARRDRSLGEEFLAKLEEENKKDAEEATRKNRENDDAFGSSAAEKRLALARRLLEDGDVQRAMEFAGPALNRVSRETITFLSALREKNSQTADQAFLTLLTIAERDPISDANTVSGLSSYRVHTFSLCDIHSRWGRESDARSRSDATPGAAAGNQRGVLPSSSKYLIAALAASRSGSLNLRAHRKVHGDPALAPALRTIRPGTSRRTAYADGGNGSRCAAGFAKRREPRDYQRHHSRQCQ